MKVCDLTQFYSPFSGGVKRYLEEKRKYANALGHEHLLIVPGQKTEKIETPGSKTFLIGSPLVSRTSRYRALLNLNAVEEVLARENPDVIESSDPYQVAWKAIASGEALRIPVVGFYHSHFPEAYLRTTMKYLGETATNVMMEVAKNYVRNLYNHFRKTFVPSTGLAQVLSDWGVENIVLSELGVDTAVFNRTPTSLLPGLSSTFQKTGSCYFTSAGLPLKRTSKRFFKCLICSAKQHPGDSICSLSETAIIVLT